MHCCYPIYKSWLLVFLNNITCDLYYSVLSTHRLGNQSLKIIKTKQISCYYNTYLLKQYQAITSIPFKIIV